MRILKKFVQGIFILSCLAAIGLSQEKAFPQDMPDEKPDRPLSAAVERNYDAYLAPRPEDNELFTQFKYTKLKGFDYHGGDGTITRRDPSKIIFHNGKYYVWYTYRNTPTPPRGPQNATETIPARDWDLCDIWYATSEDGFTWQEQGIAIPRPPKPHPGWRSVSTADILIWEEKYYLYYQAFKVDPSDRGDDCPVAVSVADSPDGPWTPTNQLVIPNGAPDAWDGFSIHDPYPLVYQGKIYLYYKSDFARKKEWVRMQGLAIAEDPLGPFEKHPLNPVNNSGHETTLFPFMEGIAALLIKDGNEHFTIQYAPDGVNFEIAAITELLPIAAGPFVPDAFTDTQYGRGISWGLCHNTQVKGHTILMRFDCDLSLDVDDPEMKKHKYSYPPEFYYQHGLSRTQRERIAGETREKPRVK
ncbi:MAG: glycoside hydrolase [Verrucomicrobiae bacterium]|nr:glycoside hydrolase [Verrucomicrobiae bacterium]